MNQDQIHHVKSIIEKVRIFHGLTIAEARQLIKLCRPQSFEKDEVIYEYGTPSTDIFIVLQGKLVAINEKGTRLGEILAGSTTGEMGALTGCVRSATVIAEEASRGFVIEAAHLRTLMRIDSEFRIKILENIVSLLSDRVMGANVQIENYAHQNKDQTSVKIVHPVR